MKAVPVFTRSKFICNYKIQKHKLSDLGRNEDSDAKVNSKAGFYSENSDFFFRMSDNSTGYETLG